jgi:hypothetical protein
MQANTEALIEKIQTLSPDRQAEVEDFVEGRPRFSISEGVQRLFAHSS